MRVFMGKGSAMQKCELLLLVVLHAACMASTQAVPHANDTKARAVDNYGVGPHDVISVRVFGESELSGDLHVSPEGTITMALIGSLSVDGLRPEQIVALLTQQLSRFFVAPQVSVIVKESHSKKIHVLGEVRSPGTFAYEAGMSIIQAITLAGGFGPLAKRDGTVVTRVIDGQEQRMEISIPEISEGHTPNFELRPGDIVYVPETLF